MKVTDKKALTKKQEDLMEKWSFLEGSVQRRGKGLGLTDKKKKKQQQEDQESLFGDNYMPDSDAERSPASSARRLDGLSQVSTLIPDPRQPCHSSDQVVGLVPHSLIFVVCCPCVPCPRYTYWTGSPL